MPKDKFVTMRIDGPMLVYLKKWAVREQRPYTNLIRLILSKAIAADAKVKR